MGEAFPEFKSAFLQDLHWRGLISQITDAEGLDAHLHEAEQTGQAASRRAYIGFDPTADSLTIGNLVPIMLLAFFQRAGHTPVVLAGGGTGLIGDPSGKSAERELRTKEQVAANVAAQQRIFSRVLNFSGSLPNHATIVNNLDWLGELRYIDALRDIGKHFSVNMMIQKDSVKERLNNREQGISYTEFSYMILQAFDFAHLHKACGVTLQMGATDQWGNIVAGGDLISRATTVEVASALAAKHTLLSGQPSGSDSRSPHQHEQLARYFRWAGTERAHGRSIAFGLTTPLLTKADGTKYGKTESGTIWLTARQGDSDTSPARTSPYALYQFLLNIPDDDVERFLKTFTFLKREEVAAVMLQQNESPATRVAQRTLARNLVDMLHGEPDRLAAEKAAAALFSGDVADLPPGLLQEVFASAPTSTHPRAQLDGEGLSLIDLLAQTLCKSKSDARQALAENSIAVNGTKAGATDRLTAASLLHGTILLRRGKKNWHVTRWA
jgi:tyrosyl-tRNA synthetase